MVDRSLNHRLRLRPFGATVSVAADDERFLAAAAFGVGHYPSTTGLELAVSISATTLARTGREPDWPVTQRREWEHGFELSSGPSRVVVERTPEGATAHVELEADLLASPDTTRVFIEAGFWSGAIGGGHLHAVHAGLVASPAGRGGLVLRGQSGAGKSTLTYACLRRGMVMSSDDWVYAPAKRPPEQLWGYPWRMWLTVEAAERFPELAEATALPHPGSDRIKVPVTPPRVRRRRSLAPAAIVFIEPSAAVGLAPIPVGDAAERFAISALDSERGSLPADFVTALLDRPCFVLARGSSPDEAAERLDHLARALDRAAR